MTEIERAIILLVQNGYRVEKIMQDSEIPEQQEFDQEITELELDGPIDKIYYFGTRTRNALAGQGINTAKQLLEWDAVMLSKAPGIGKKTIREIISTLAVYGLKLKAK